MLVCNQNHPLDLISSFPYKYVSTYLPMYLFIIFILLVQSNLFLVLHHAVVEEEKVFSILKNQLLDLQFAHYTYIPSIPFNFHLQILYQVQLPNQPSN